MRRIAKSSDPKTRIKAANKAAAGLRRDLALFAVAEQITARASWVQPGKTTAGARLARVAKIEQKTALQHGILVQELIAFRASRSLRAMLAALEGPDGELRDKAWSEAPKHGVSPVFVLGFLDRFKTVSHIGPDVIRLTAFVQGCQHLRRVPTIAAFCNKVRSEFRVPDDYLARVRALEQLYLDSAGHVIRFCRVNFEQVNGNPGADGKFREVGLDYNHGRNVGWDPATGQFVLFDI